MSWETLLSRLLVYINAVFVCLAFLLVVTSNPQASGLLVVARDHPISPAVRAFGFNRALGADTVPLRMQPVVAVCCCLLLFVSLILIRYESSRGQQDGWNQEKLIENTRYKRKY